MSLVDYTKGIASAAADAVKSEGEDAFAPRANATAMANATANAGTVADKVEGEDALTPRANGVASQASKDFLELMGEYDDKPVDVAKAYDDTMAGAKPVMTKEERAKEAKKHRRNQIFAAIGDGVSALANLYFTSQYAPNMYSKDDKTLSEREKIRYDKLIDEDDAARLARFNALVKVNDANDKERKWQRILANDAYKAQKDAEEAAAKAAAAETKANQWQQEFNRKTGRDEANDQYREDSLEIKRQNAENRGGGGSGGGSRKPYEFVAYDADGNEHRFQSSEAAEQFARRHGTWEEYDIVDETDKWDRRGNPDGSSEKRRKGGYSKKPSPTGGKKSPTK